MEVVERGGRVVVIDPRRTETARQFEHLPIRPDADAWMLLSMLNVIFEEGLTDERFVAQRTAGVEVLERWAADHPPEQTEAITSIPARAVA